MARLKLPHRVTMNTFAKTCTMKKKTTTTENKTHRIIIESSIISYPVLYFTELTPPHYMSIKIEPAPQKRKTLHISKIKLLGNAVDANEFYQKQLSNNMALNELRVLCNLGAVVALSAKCQQ